MRNSNDLEKLNDTWIWYSDTYDESFSFRITKYHFESDNGRKRTHLDHLGGFSFRKRKGVDVTGLDSSVFGFG